MNESEHKTGLYRWERQSKPKVYSRSQRVTTNNDIQDWIKKVEDASVKATDVAFGLKPSGKERGKAAAQMKSRQVRDQEDAYAEAQELLNQWVNDKVHFNEDDGLDDLEAWRRARNMKKQAETSDKRYHSNNITDTSDEPFSKWLSSKGLDSSLDFDETEIYERVKRSAVGDEDPYANLLEMDEQDAVSSVLKAMMSKEVIKDTFKRDVDDVEKDAPDPRTRMELRHRMVKENREKRQEEERRRLAEKQMKKDARLKAQQMILKEQRARDNKTRQEEADIKKEMAKIRKDLLEENRRKEETLRRDREEKELIARLAKEEFERQRRAEEEEILSSHRSETERKQKQLIKMEIWRAKQENKRLKTLHIHFTVWHNLVLTRHLQVGKVKAMADWKLMVKVWTAFKSYVRNQRAQVEADHHERQIIDSHRKVLIADRHHNGRLLRRCLEGWKLFAQEEIERKTMEQEKEKTKAKMMALLNAVAEGKVNSEKEPEDKKGTKSSTHRSKSHASNHDRDVDLNNTQTGSSRPEKPMQAWLDPKDALLQPQQQLQQQRLRPSSAASHHPSSASSRRTYHPMEPWQVTKKHVQLGIEEIRNLGHHGVEEEDDGETPRSDYTDAEIRKRFGTQPWMNRHYVVNNFEHRYMAQQKALREQQDQIKEQRQMIEELKYQQNHQQLKRQLAPQGSTVRGQEAGKVEAPLKGRQIPRDEDEIERVDENGMISGRALTNANNNHEPSSVTDVGNKDEEGSLVGGQGSNTDRSNLTTARSKATSSTVSVPQGNTKYLQVLKNMEDRAAQRARQKAEREERRRQQEEEKLAELERQEEEQRKQIEEEKRAKVEAFRLKKRLEKQKEEERQRELERQKELMQMAEAHYNRALLKYRCLLPLKKLVGLAKRNWLRAVKHHNRLLLRQMLREWKLFTDTEIGMKQQTADQMAEFLLVKHSFQRWKKYKYHSQFLLKRADRHFNTALKVKTFHVWTEFVVLEREASVRNAELAQEHYLHYLLRSSFLAWRYLPEQQKREEERKKRKLELRQRVAELIPDYVPCASPAASQDLLDK